MKTIFKAGLALALLVAITCMAQAAVPRTIAFQASVKTAAGLPINGDVSVTLSLYDVATGGTALWSEPKTVTAAKGVITTSLGEPTPFPSTVLFDRPYWVGVKVGADAEMVPRLPLMSVPYALGLSGVTVSSGGSFTFPSAVVLGDFDVGGTVTARGGATVLGDLSLTNHGISRVRAIYANDSTNFDLLPGQDNPMYIKTGANGSVNIGMGGNVSLNVSGGLAVGSGASCTTLTLTSSRRYKEDIQPIKNALGTVSKLQGVRYDWDAAHGGKPDIGFIAEDVANVVPELVTMEPDGKAAQGMDYSHLTALTVEAIKEQQKQIATLKAENAELKARLARVERLLSPKATTRPGK